ncbi:uncharacterized protein Bfra_002013 [Botrytis fragariae]|uniref:Uncharacterized protein n=1 Tax=Botrytis fragariae TaxID=1964551 RepID=A0A8H6B1F3_9HELO|nr:uncharacterized protein Bfra_002013 [Botrytis fragariae]KAF5877646.1 hypothetical protein Bfra_002013 [Botrytis fragariae]
MRRSTSSNSMYWLAVPMREPGEFHMYVYMIRVITTAKATVSNSQVLSTLLWSQLLKLYFFATSLVPVRTSENISAFPFMKYLRTSRLGYREVSSSSTVSSSLVPYIFTEYTPRKPSNWKKMIMNNELVGHSNV